MLNGEVYVGDTAPAVTQVMRMAGGDICNLSDLNFCVHNGTHIDAPYHFIENGKSIDEVELRRCFGEATVIEVEKKPENLNFQAFFNLTYKTKILNSSLKESLFLLVDKNQLLQL